MLHPERLSVVLQALELGLLTEKDQLLKYCNSANNGKKNQGTLNAK